MTEKTEWNKRIQGSEYDSSDEYLISLRRKAKKILKEYYLSDEDPITRKRLLEELLVHG